MKGKITKLYPSKGYGFIEGEDGLRYFLHATECQPRGIFDLTREGMVLDFDWEIARDGRRAKNVRSEVLRAQLAS